MAEVASAFVTLIPSFRGGAATISKELDGPAEAAGKQAGDKAGKGFGSTFVGGLKGLVAPLAGVFAGAKIAGFFGDSIQAASGLGESINALNLTFGDASEGVQALGKTAATSLGLSNLEFNNLAVRFSSFAKTVAGEGGDVTGTIDELTTRASDFASVMNLDVAEAAQIFQSSLAGESEPIKQFGINLSAAAVQSFAYANGIAKAGAQLTDTQKVQATYGLLMEKTSAFAGDFANTSDSLANQQKILGSRFADTKVVVGNALLPAMQGLVGFATGTLLPGLEKLAGFLGTTVVPGFEALYDLLIKGDFTAEFARIFNVQEDAPIVAVLLNVRDAAKEFGTYVTDTLIPGIDDFIDKLDELKKPIGITAAVITAVFVPALVKLAVQQALTATASMAAAVKSAIAWGIQKAAAIGAAAAMWVAVTRILVGWAVMAAQAMANAVRMAFAWVVGVAIPAAAAAVQMGLAVVRVVAGWVVMATQSLIQAARMAAAWFIAMGPVGWVILAVVALVALIIANWDKIVAWTKQAWTAVTAWLKKAWENIKTTASNVWNAVLDFFRAIPGKIVQFFLNWTLPGLLIKHWSSIKDGATRGFNAVVDFVKGIPAKIVSGLGNLGSLLYDAGKRILDGLTNGIRDKVAGAVRAVKDAVGSVINGAKNLLGIASPSKVFMELGGYVAEGLALGISGGRAEVAAAADRLVSVPRVPRPGVEGIGGPGAGGAMDLSMRSIKALGREILDGAQLVSFGAVSDHMRALQLAGRGV